MMTGTPSKNVEWPRKRKVDFSCLETDSQNSQVGGDVRKGLNTETAKLGTFNNFLMEKPSIEVLIVLKKEGHIGLLKSG
jgi:hypothetical protein